MTSRVVTISASYGAGAAAIGPLLAERLGLPFADRLIEPHDKQAPSGEGVTRAERDEEPRSALLRSLTLLSPTWNLPSAPEEPEDVPDKMRDAVEASIRAEIDRGGAVILGRAAAVVIGRDHRWAFHVRLDGPKERRTRRGAMWEGIDVQAAAARLAETDTARDRYVQRLYGREVRDPKLYHLILDSTVLSTDACVELLAIAAQDYWSYDEANLGAAITRARARVEQSRR